MMKIQTPQTLLPTGKSIALLNPINQIPPNSPQPKKSILFNNIIQANIPQVISTNNAIKRYPTPITIRRNPTMNGISTATLKNFNTFTAYNTPKIIGSQNYLNGAITNLNNPNNLIRVNPLVNGNMNNIVTNQNIINNAQINNPIMKNMVINPNLTNTITSIKSPNIVNNMAINQKLISTIRSIKGPNLINNLPNTQNVIINNVNNNANANINSMNLVQIPSLVKTNKTINSMVLNQNTIKSINRVPTNISYTINNSLNPTIKPITNNVSVIPKVEIGNTLNNPNVSLIPKLNAPLVPVNNPLLPQIQVQPQMQSQLQPQIQLQPQPNLINSNMLALNNNLREPSERINLQEFRVLNEIGEGTFGKIYKVLWLVNNKFYALKKEVLKEIDGVKVRQHRNEAIRAFIKNTNCGGIVKLYGNLTIQNGYEFQYFELMELCDKDFEKEIKERSAYNQFYTELELYNIMLQLISTLSFLQKMHITHRDIKPQNILISNGIYKLCDFGDIRVMQREGIVVQRVRGSELYMSPILFNGLRAKVLQVRHNTYKSDVFSLGMCFLLASCLSFDGCVEIREVSDMNQKLFILNKYIGRRYSPNLIKILHSMLQTEEINRPDFILLETALRQHVI